MAVTIVDIAKEANCSPATVSLVMKDSNKIKDSTKERIREIADRLGYHPNQTARSLINGQTNTIGVIVPTLENPIFSQMVSGIEEVLNASGYNMMLGTTNSDIDRERICMNMLSESRADGLIISPSHFDKLFPKFINGANNKKIPLVLCGSSCMTGNNLSYVKCDNHIGGYTATEHLIKAGRKHIACICAVYDKPQANSRVRGYMDALAFYGVDFEPELLVYCSQKPLDIISATEQLLSEHEVDGVFCLYDYMSIAVIRTIQKMGRKIPEDIAVVGYDNIPITEYLPISLSTIDTHSRQVGASSAKLLIGHIQDVDADIKQIQIKPDLVIRESSAINKNE